MSIYLYRYNNVLNSGTNFDMPAIQTYVPSPTADDYVRGYITRYFVQKRNDKNSPIYEISYDGYTTFIGHFYYGVVALDWKLTGTDDEIKTANGKSARLAAKTLPAIINYLPYLLQFKKQ